MRLLCALALSLCVGCGGSTPPTPPVERSPAPATKPDTQAQDAAATQDLHEYIGGFVGTSWHSHLKSVEVERGTIIAHTDIYPDADAQPLAASFINMAAGWAHSKDNPHKIRSVRVYGSTGSAIGSKSL